MISAILNSKLNFLITFLASFSVGAFFIDNPNFIGNILGAIISTVIINLVNSYRNKRKK